MKILKQTIIDLLYVYFFIIAFIVLTLSFTSCNNEDIEPSSRASNQKTNMLFTVSAKDNTKYMGTIEYGVDKLEKQVNSNTLSHQFSVELEAGQFLYLKVTANKPMKVQIDISQTSTNYDLIDGQVFKLSL